MKTENILYIPPKTAIKEDDSFYRELKNYGDVVWYWEFPYNDWYLFDLIHFQSGAVSQEIIKKIRGRSKKRIITQWTGDYRPEPMDMITQYTGLVDLTFMAADVPELYPDLECRWLPHWVDDWQFREVKEDAEGIVMIANNYPQFPGGKERAELNELLKHRKDYKVYGNGWENSSGFVDWKLTPDIYNNARFAVGCNIYNDVPKYFSNRPLWAMAGGAFYCMRYVPGIYDFFGEDDAVYYEDNKWLVDWLNLGQPALNEYAYEFAKQGQKVVKENFHVKKIVKNYIDEVFK